MAEHEEGVVGLGGDEAKMLQVCGEALIPSSGRLRIDEACRLLSMFYTSNVI